MVITRILCDVCGKEVPTYSDLETINMNTKSIMHRSYDVCGDCYAKIGKYIETMCESKKS